MSLAGRWDLNRKRGAAFRRSKVVDMSCTAQCGSGQKSVGRLGERGGQEEPEESGCHVWA